MSKSIDFRELDTKDDSQQEMAIEHWDEVFVKTPKEYFQRHVEKNPMNWLCPVFCAFDGEVLASTLKIFNRAIFVHSDIVSMGGIAEVATKEAYRGQGLATQLVDQSLAYLEGRGIQISALGAAPEAAKMYSAAGYTSVPQVIANSSWSAWCQYFANERFTNAVEVSLVTPSELESEQIGQMKVLSNATAARLNGCLIRTQDYFGSWVVAEASQKGYATAIAVDTSGDIAGYVIASAYTRDEKTVVRINEFCVKDEFEEQGIAEFQLLLGQIIKADSITEVVQAANLSMDDVTVQIPVALLSYGIQQRISEGTELNLNDVDPKTKETYPVKGTEITLSLETGTMYWTSVNFASRMAEKECENIVDFMLKPSQEGQVYPYYFFDIDCY